MSIYQSIDDIEYLTCPLPQHNEQMSIVCLDKACYKKMLICPICEINQHQGHTTIPLKKYLAQNSSKSKDEVGSLLLEKMNQLQEIKMNAKGLFSKLRQSFLDQIYVLQHRVAQYFNKLSDKFIEIHQLDSRQYLLKALKRFSDKNQIQKCNEMLKNMKVGSLASIKGSLNYYIMSTQLRFATFKTIINDFQFKQKFSKSRELFRQVQDPYVKPVYVWSALRSPKINVQGLVASQTASSSSGERFALLQSKQQFYPDITTSFKIRKLKGWIGVGICLKNVIVKSGYKFNYTIYFHGSYLISANGYSWSHSQPEFNSSQKSFTFAEGDVIKVSYNSANKVIIFQNAQKGNQFKLSVIDPPPNDCYVPCVNMCNPGDQVQIVNDAYDAQ